MPFNKEEMGDKEVTYIMFISPAIFQNLNMMSGWDMQDKVYLIMETMTMRIERQMKYMIKWIVM